MAGGRHQGQGALTKVDCFVFDLDGTLITFPVAWDKVREELKAITGSSSLFNPFFLDFESFVARRPELREPMLAVVDKYEAAAVDDARLNPGAKEALTELSSRTRLALVTMQGAAACEKILRRLDIGRFFVAKFTREDSMDRVVQLGAAVKRLGPAREKVVFVGDRKNDLRAAREVGVRFVMIRSHSDSPPADALYRSMSEFAASPWVKGSGA